MMVKKKKKQSRSQSSKLANGKESKHMVRGMSSKSEQGLSSQSRVVRCPKCHKFLHEPVDVTVYKCSGCNSVLQAKRSELENNGKDLLSSQNSISSTEVESAEGGGSKTPVRGSYRKYSSRASPCFERGNDSETAYMRHETSYEWMTRAASPRSCTGVVKRSITKKEDTTLLDLLRFSASGSHLSSSDKGSGDRICISTDAANLETFEGKGSEEDIRSISSKFKDLKLKTFQPSLNHKLRKQKPASSEEESAEGGGSKTPVRSIYRKFSSRASPLFETASRRRHETTHIRREWMTSASPSPSSYGYSSPFHGSASEQSYHHHHQPNQFKGWFQESSAAASPISFQGETSDQKCYNWSSQQSQMLHDSQHHNHHESSSWSGVLKLSTTKKEEDNNIRRSVSSEFYDLKPEAFQPQWNHKSSEAIGETSRIHLEQSEEALNKNERVWETNLLSEITRDMQEFDWGEFKWEDILGDKRDSICHRSSSNGEKYEDTVEDTKHISNQSFIGNPDQSGKATVATYRIYEEQSKHDEYENISERQELDKNISDRVRYELEDARLETWAETMEDRAGLHLEEYETNYESYRNPFEWSSEGAAPTFDMPVYEPEEEAQGRSIFSSIDFLNDHESSKEKDVPWQVDENKIEELKVGVVVGDGPSTTLEETFGLTGESTPMFCLPEPELLSTLLEPDNEEADDGSSKSSSSTGSFNNHEESSKQRALFHQEEPQVMMSDSRTGTISVNLEERFEWTSERAPTFRLYDEPEPQDAYGRSESSSRDQVMPKEREMDHGEDSRLVTDEDRPWLVDAYETKALKVDVMAAKDGPSLNLEKFENEKLLLDQTVEPREGIFRLSLDEQGWVKFESETSPDMQVSLMQTFKQGDTEANTPASAPMLSSERYESPSKIAQVESEAEEKSGLTSEIVVGLRHALYQTQTSPLSSPIYTPNGSPLHILMRSPVDSHIVSPLRSPTNSSGSTL